jgi:hypothetical protein
MVSPPRPCFDPLRDQTSDRIEGQCHVHDTMIADQEIVVDWLP